MFGPGSNGDLSLLRSANVAWAVYFTSLGVSFLINITNVVQLTLVKSTLLCEENAIISHGIGKVYKHLGNRGQF